MMVANHTVTAHHPVLHTLLLGNIVQALYSLTGSFNKGAFAYTLVQLGISGLCFAYVLTFLYTMGAPKNTYGFWYPKASLILSADGTMGYFSCHSMPPAQDNSKIPIIYNYYQLFNNSRLVQNSWIMILFSPGSYFFLFLYTCLYQLCQKRKAASAVLTFTALFWLTFLLGPVALVRYVAFLYYMVPLEVYLLFVPPQP